MLGNNQMMPNRKTDTNNNGGFSTDNIGMNYDYPDGDYATRDKILQEHVTYQQGLMWFLANDPRVPEKVRNEIEPLGTGGKDEFTDTGDWPHQLYVREARRMMSDYVMTQRQLPGRHELAPDPVGLAAYGMDSHNTQRYVKDGYASNEGDVQVHGFQPYPIAYRSIVPKAAECANLLVPVCLSASHIAYGSIRMEPVFMVLGQSAATAACQAIDQHASVQQIDMPKLRERLLADGQILEWKGPRVAGGAIPARCRALSSTIPRPTFVGEWTEGRGQGRLFSAPATITTAGRNRGPKKPALRFPFPRRGRYEVRLGYTALGNRATNVPVTVESADGAKTVTVNERQEPAVDKLFQPLGVFRFSAETSRRWWSSPTRAPTAT